MVTGTPRPHRPPAASIRPDLVRWERDNFTPAPFRRASRVVDTPRRCDSKRLAAVLDEEPWVAVPALVVAVDGMVIFLQYFLLYIFCFIYMYLDGVLHGDTG